MSANNIHSVGFDLMSGFPQLSPRQLSLFKNDQFQLENIGNINPIVAHNDNMNNQFAHQQQRIQKSFSQAQLQEQTETIQDGGHKLRRMSRAIRSQEQFEQLDELQDINANEVLGIGGNDEIELSTIVEVDSKTAADILAANTEQLPAAKNYSKLSDRTIKVSKGIDMCVSAIGVLTPICTEVISTLYPDSIEVQKNLVLSTSIITSITGCVSTIKSMVLDYMKKKNNPTGEGANAQRRRLTHNTIVCSKATNLVLSSAIVAVSTVTGIISAVHSENKKIQKILLNINSAVNIFGSNFGLIKSKILDKIKKDPTDTIIATNEKKDEKKEKCQEETIVLADIA